MTRLVMLFILSLATLVACNQGKSSRISTNETMMARDVDDNFQKVINGIKKSDAYENPENWKKRGLNPSDQSVIQILRNTTNNFLIKLEEIYNSNESTGIKLRKISILVDELPWYELDTEEREFLADTLAPAIEAAGFDPWSIF